MIANWLKILLFAAGGSSAAAGTAYYTGLLDPWFQREAPAQMSAAEPVATAQRPEPAVAAPESAPAATDATGREPDQAAPEPDQAEAALDQAEAAPDQAEAAPDQVDAAPDQVDADAPPAPTEERSEPAEPKQEIAALPKDPAGAATSDPLVTPSFDIVRVEPDGSMVIAGKAEPSSQIEVVSGADVLARASTGVSGDFAAVVDDQLEPGDYQIVLRSTGPDEGQVTTSLETAIVSVPEEATGQVLALVEEPGAPSKLITVPEAEMAKEAEPQIAAVGEDTQADESGTQAAAPVNQQPAEGAAEEPAGENAGEDTQTDEQIAAVEQPAPDVSETSPRVMAPSDLAVEAIEIEGRTVFVAGRGEPGATVRVYANEILLGEALVSDGGRFLIETQIDLPVGDYIVRADVIGAGGEVTTRAAVPFEREPGEAIAAVAPPQPAAPVQPDASAQADAPAQPAAPAGNVAPVEDAQTVEEDAVAGDQPAQAPAGDGTPASSGSAPAVASAAQDAAGEEATGKEATGEDASGQDATVAANSGMESTESDSSAGGTTEAPVEAGETEAPTTEMAAAPTAIPAPTAPTPAVAGETLAPKLESVDGSVIIRRGDSLWRISRRVYGRGVRYSTIYLANQDQIRDPDMIWPGQVFSVPDETKEGERADMSTISDQIAPPAATE